MDESTLSPEEQKERKIMKLLLKIKNGTPPMRKVGVCFIWFGGGAAPIMFSSWFMVELRNFCCSSSRVADPDRHFQFSWRVFREENWQV